MKPSLLVFFICFASHAFGQYNRDIFLEIGGSGGLGSLNFEKVMFDSGGDQPEGRLIRHTNDTEKKEHAYKYTWRAGFSLAPIDRNNGTALVFPLMVNYIVGQTNQFDAGIGLAPSITTKGAFYVRSPLSFCYRFQRWNKPFFFRAGYTPIVSYLFDFQWEHWFGVSIGYSFNREKK